MDDKRNLVVNVRLVIGWVDWADNTNIVAVFEHVDKRYAPTMCHQLDVFKRLKEIVVSVGVGALEQWTPTCRVCKVNGDDKEVDVQLKIRRLVSW